MNLEGIIFDLGVIIVGAAALGTLFLYIKQPILIAYIAAGFLIGPHGFAFIENVNRIENIAHFGVILLLFLVGLNLQPLKLFHLFRKTIFITFGTSMIFGVLSFVFALLLQFDIYSALLFGSAMMFSSTVISLKLVPTTTLHHKRTGEIMTGVLLLQDMMAILVILFVTGKKNEYVLLTFGILALKLLILSFLAFVGVRYIVVPLLRKFDIVQEYTFITTLGWCLLWAETAQILGLSYELGAFIAGLSIASCRAALVIAEHLKPLREFFLILFFFGVGAGLNFGIDLWLILYAVVFGIILVFLKASVFRFAFKKSGESMKLSKELSVRLSQSSEFSLLVVFAALSTGILSMERAMVVQVATITTFIISTYWTVLHYPTPISMSAPLRKD
ncbi:MAG: cation:proton antiporter [Elusimicrobiota bacterium]|nr:cation:proton antiporter [Elusimicrobiota bacterium]